MKLERRLAWPCRDCTVRSSSFCGTLIDRSSSRPPSAQNQISQVFLSADRHNVIRHSGKKYLSGPFVLCKGWAYRFYRFPDGRRQILSVLIPGDMFSAFTLFDPHSDFSVQAVTDIKVCQLGQDDIKRELAAEPGICDAFGKICSIEIDEIISTSIDLNERDAVKRIVGFVQRLVKRLSDRGIAIRADAYPFPLSHTDIADATGLTPDDVNRAIQNLRENSIIDISNNKIIIIDPAKFEKHAMVPARE